MEFVLETGSLLTHRASDRTFAQIDLGHWLRVRQARHGSHYPDNPAAEHSIYEVGCTVANRFTLELFTLVTLEKAWMGGDYVRGVLESASGHRESVVVRNRRSVHPDIVRQAAEFEASYERYEREQDEAHSTGVAAPAASHA